MALEISYDSMDAVPEQFRELYSEEGGKAVLTGINGLKTQADIDRIQEGLRKEKKDHKETKDKLRAFGDLNPDEIRAQLDRIPELELAAEGKLDDEKINSLVEKRIGQKTAPLERQIQSLNDELTESRNKNNELSTLIQRRDLHDTVRNVALEMKVQPTALPDVEMVAERYLERTDDGNFIVKDGMNGITPGLDVKGFMREMQQARPHWWPPSEGGGARGARGGLDGRPNPWTKDGWNLTEQGRVVNTAGRAVAEEMAKSAGTTFGGPRPDK